MNMPASELTAFDRCDRCGAQARNIARKSNHEDLLFCDHHIREHFESLVECGWIVHTDEKLSV